MSRYLVTMPQLGESVTEGTISRWLINPGDRIVEFDAMVEINTDKVDAEVPAPVTGVLTEILAPEGAVVPVGANIAVMEVASVAGSDATVVTPVPDVATPPHQTERVDARADASGAEPAEIEHSPIAASLPPVSSPPIRAPTPLVQPPGLDGDEVVRLTPMRRRIAENMALSKATIPHAWQVQEVDMSGVASSLAANRGSVRRQHGTSLSYLAFVVAAAAAALRKLPEVNSTFAGDHLVVHRAINIGIAVGLPEGVVVPVIKGADRLGIAELAKAIGDVTTRARAKQLVTDDVSGATFTVNNSGSLGTLLSYSVIAPGQSALVTMCSVMDRPIAVSGTVEVRPMMYLSLSLDHRVMDGLQAAEFLGACRQWLEGVTLTNPPV